MLLICLMRFPLSLHRLFMCSDNGQQKKQTLYNKTNKINVRRLCKTWSFTPSPFTHYMLSPNSTYMLEQVKTLIEKNHTLHVHLSPQLHIMLKYGSPCLVLFY